MRVSSENIPAFIFYDISGECCKILQTALCWIHSAWLKSNVPSKSLVNCSLSMWSCKSSTESSTKTLRIFAKLKNKIYTLLCLKKE